MSNYFLLLAALLGVALVGCLAEAADEAPRAEIKTIESAAQALGNAGYDGIVLLYDLTEDVYLTSDPERIEERFIPASTFKIFSSLVALETGVLPTRETVMPWDGIERSRPEINKDLKLAEAFQVSAVPHYQELVRRVGATRMQALVDSAAYGNRDISGGIDQFWLTGALRISPKEQIAFLRNLHSGTLPFSGGVMGTVREIMITESSDDYVIRGKTGWGIADGITNTGWWVGWVEAESNVYFFATVIQAESPGQNFGSARIAITNEVLREIGIL